MEILQLIFSVIAGLGAGALGALLATRRHDDDPEQEMSLTDRLQEIEHRAEAETQRVDQLAEAHAADLRDMIYRLQAAVHARDERIDALQERMTHAVPGRPRQTTSDSRQHVRIDQTVGRLESVEGDLSRLEQRFQAKLIAMRESTQDVLRRLAEHQIEEAERVTHLTSATNELNERFEELSRRDDENERPTTAALVEVLETQFVLTERATALEHQVDESLQQLEAHLTDIETRLLALDDLQARLAQVRPADEQSDQLTALKAAVDRLEQRQSAGPTAASSPAKSAKTKTLPPDALEHIFGIGPKLARQLEKHGVPDVPALAALTEDDIERLGPQIRGFKDRLSRHDWIGQAKKLVAERPAPATNGEPAPVAVAHDPPAEPPPAPTPAWTGPIDPDTIH